MLESLYQSLFRPNEAPVPLSQGGMWGFWVLLSTLQGFQFGAQLAVDATGILALTLGFFTLNTLAWLWLSALTQLLAEFSGGKGHGLETLGAIASAFWPGILMAPLGAVAGPPGKFAQLLSFGVFVWIAVLLVRAIARTHDLSLGKSTLCLLGASATATLSAVALLVAPLTALIVYLGA